MPMETRDTVRVLSRLVHLDVDALLAFEQALARVPDPELREALTRLRADHERHVEDLSAAIRSLGREPPGRRRDAEGFFIAGFTAIRSHFGPEAAISALRDNARLAAETYGTALGEDLPEFCRELVDRGYRDEERHVERLEEALGTRSWEPRPTA